MLALKRSGHSMAEAWSRLEASRRVSLVAWSLITVQLCFHAWLVVPAWFIHDDYNFLADGRQHALDLSYLLTPYSGHLMPGGRLLTWLVARSGTLNWALAAAGSLLLQALASTSAWLMLVRLFGHRVGLLAPLALYLFSALTVPTKLWWIASVSHLPVQIAFFVGVTCWVEYLRRPTAMRFLLASAAAASLGMLFDVRGILILPVFAFLSAAYFSTGTWWRRLGRLLRTYWKAWALFVALGAAYSGYYLLEVPQISRASLLHGFPAITSVMLGRSFVSGVLGGPWRWNVSAPPTAFSDPPVLFVQVAWAVLALLVAYFALRRSRTGRAWALLLGYLLVTAVIVSSARAGNGEVVGREYRYLSDAMCLVALCLGLASHKLLGATESSEPRPGPPLVAPAPRALATGLVVVVALSGLWNSTIYGHIWHRQNASDAYMHTLAKSARAHAPVDLVSTPTPEGVMNRLLYPRNNTKTLASLLDVKVRFPSESSRLLIVDDHGALRPVGIDAESSSTPGPMDGCGWRVTHKGASIPLQDAVRTAPSWMRIGYLASAPSSLTIGAGPQSRTVSIASGLGTLYVRTSAVFDTVEITGLRRGQSLCVDTIQVGRPVPGGPL